MKRNPRQHQLPSLQLKRALFNAAIDALEAAEWTIERDQKSTSTSIRRITRAREDGQQTARVAIRTSQNGSIAFTRDAADTGWVTLRDVDYVIVSCVDDPKKPVCAWIQVYEADRVEDAFTNAYRKSKRKGTAGKPTTGFWLPVYELRMKEKRRVTPYWPIINRNETFIELKRYMLLESNHAEGLAKDREKYFLTIPEARRRLALTLGVHESEIHIKIDSSKSRGELRRR